MPFVPDYESWLNRPREPDLYKDEYVPLKKWQGPYEGFYFGTGDQGLGYYRDHDRHRLAEHYTLVGPDFTVRTKGASDAAKGRGYYYAHDPSRAEGLKPPEPESEGVRVAPGAERDAVRAAGLVTRKKWDEAAGAWVEVTIEDSKNAPSVVPTPAAPAIAPQGLPVIERPSWHPAPGASQATAAATALVPTPAPPTPVEPDEPTADVPSFYFSDEGELVKVYVPLDGVKAKVPADGVTCEFTASSFHLRVRGYDADGRVLRLRAKQLFGDVVPAESKHRVLNNKVVVTLKKRTVGSAWARVDVATA